jgi:hypothetical protein
MDANTQDMPKSFYSWDGQNYLGKPVTVPVEGESSTGASASGVAAIPSGGAGGTGPATAGSSAAAAPTSSGAVTAAQEALQGVQASASAEKLGEGFYKQAQAPPVQNLDIYGPSTGLGPYTAGGLKGPEGVPVAVDPTTGFAAQQAVIDPSTGAATGGAGVGASDVASGGAGAAAGAGSLAVPAAGAVLAGQQFLPAQQKLQAQAIESGLTVGGAGMMGVLDASILFPDFVAQLVSNPGAIINDKPPAVAFPGNTWADIQGQVSPKLPPTLPVPTGATPEQRTAIEQANQQIAELAPFGSGPMPSFLQGNQSEESWGNTMRDLSSNLESRFSTLDTAYPAAYKAFLAGQPTMPAGAPKGYADAFSVPMNAFQAAMQANDYAAASKALAQMPTEEQQKALNAQYAPELQAGQVVPEGFYRGDTLPKQQAAP